MVACIAITAGFQTSNSLTAAFGLSVCFVMTLTTVMYAAIVTVHFRKPWPLALLFLLFFGAVDVGARPAPHAPRAGSPAAAAAFLSSTLLKFVSGGWFTIAVSAVLFLYMVRCGGERAARTAPRRA
jgi:KUP system potassium uptake protein